MPLRAWLLSLLLMAAISGSTAAAVDKPEESAASRLFEKIEGRLGFQAVFDFPAYWFYLGAPAFQGEAYLPSFGPRLGPRMSWDDVGLTATFALPIPDTERYRRGSGASTDVVLNSYWRQNAIDVYYQHFRGFYATSAGRELSAHRPARYPQFPDATVTNAGLNWYYVFQPDQFSLKAAFDQTEFQRESGGSWLFEPFFNHLEMFLGSSFVPGDGDDSVQGVPNLASGRFETAGSTFGYGYSYVSGRFFASALGAAGPGAQLQRLNRSEGTSVQPGLALKINLNAAAGWNGKEYLGGVQFLFDSLTCNVAGTQVASNLLSGKVFFGARF